METDYQALRNLHKRLKNFIEVWTVDGKYIGDWYAFETYERLDMFLNDNMEKKSHKFSKREEIHE